MVKVSIDTTRLKVDLEAAKKAVTPLADPVNRKALIDAALAGLVNCLREHFRYKESLPQKISGFPWFGQSHPKRYFWSGTSGSSLSEMIRITKSDPATLSGEVSIPSSALARLLSSNPAPIRPTPPRKYLAVPASPAAAAFQGMPHDFPSTLKFSYSSTPSGKRLPSLVEAALSPSQTPSPIYWLIRSANPPTDPTALPSDSAFVAAVSSALRSAL